MKIDNGYITMTSCCFTDNSAKGSGGGLLFRDFNYHIAINSCSFIKNTVPYEGGGLYLGVGNEFMTLTSCTFTQNAASEGNGGGLLVDDANHFIVLSSCTFTDNSAGQEGGGIFLNTDSLNMAASTAPLRPTLHWTAAVAVSFSLFRMKTRCLETVTFTPTPPHRTAEACLWTVTMAIWKSRLVSLRIIWLLTAVGVCISAVAMMACNFTGSTAQFYGGGLFVNSDNDGMSLTACLFLENSTHLHGGGHVCGEQQLGHGAAADDVHGQHGRQRWGRSVLRVR